MVQIFTSLIFLLSINAYAESATKIDCKKLSPSELRSIDQDDCIKGRSEKVKPIENSINKFYSQTTQSILTCELTANSELLNINLGGKLSFSAINACIENEKIKVKELFKKAIPLTKKKPQSERLLKDYYSTWTTRLNAVQIRTGEQLIDYKHRQNDELSKTNSAWDKFEIEFNM